MPSPPAGRAVTDEQRRDLVERLLAAWKKCPQLRFGQFLIDACEFDVSPPVTPVYYAEDDVLVRKAELFASKR